ncbi:MAG TPA: methyltransferase [Gemmatimonadaceae bacterium]|nr:methyltransferase [Gemmatimonadaceae bacterium]
MKTWQTALLIALVCAGLYVALRDQYTGVWATHQIVGLAIMVPSLFLWALARLQLGISFSGEARATVLVTHGLYAKIRNPIYVFGGIFIAGLIVFLGYYYFMLVFLIIIPVQYGRFRNEEAVLEAAFGDKYRTYRRQTWF